MPLPSTAGGHVWETLSSLRVEKQQIILSPSQRLQILGLLSGGEILKYLSDHYLLDKLLLFITFLTVLPDPCRQLAVGIPRAFNTRASLCS
jgi:hypothetical protein